MKRICLVIVILMNWQMNSAPTSLGAVTPGRQSAEKGAGADNIIGEISALDRQAGLITVRTDRAGNVKVKVAENTVCSRIPAGETSLAHAVSIQFLDVQVGDRVLARGSIGANGNQFEAQRLIVVSKTEIEGKRERDRGEWQQRGIAGAVKALDPQAIVIEVEVQGANGPTRVTIRTVKCAFRRYAPGSVSFADAQPSSFGELRIGDQLRARGERSADGKSFDAEIVVSGSFQTFGAVVTAVDAERNEIQAKTLDKQQPITISLSSKSSLRRIPPQLAAVIAKAVVGRASSDGAHSQRSSSSQSAAPAQNQAAAGPQSGSSSAQNLQRTIDSLPGLALADIKAGDVVAATGTRRGNTDIAAIKCIAGVDAVLKEINALAGKRQTVALSAGLPAGVFDFSFGPQ